MSKPSMSLAEKAYDRVEEMIVTLELEPGSVFSEVELSKRIEIGRTPLREALQRLSADRLVKTMPRRGMVVTEINIREQLALLETRRHRGDELGQLGIVDAPAGAQVLMQGMCVELGEHIDLAQPRMEAVAEHEVDDAIGAAEGHRGLGAIPGQGTQRGATLTGEDDDESVASAIHGQSELKPAAVISRIHATSSSAAPVAWPAARGSSDAP